MATGAWVRVDRATFDRWAQALPGLALPEELRPPGSPDPAAPTAVPPLVAASLAVHGCAEVAVTVRLTMPDRALFGCFGLAGELAAGLVRRAGELDVGLFPATDVVEQVVGLVPVEPPPPADVATGCVRIGVLGPDAAVPGWQQILVSGESHWCRMVSGSEPHRFVPVRDARRELAADLRFALVDALAAQPGGERG